MPWCPVCKNEYREGFTMCSDCKVELVDSLTEDTVEGNLIKYTFGNPETMGALAEFLKYGGLSYAEVKFDDAITDSDNCFIEIYEEEEPLARNLTAVFYTKLNTAKVSEVQAEEDVAISEENEPVNNSFSSGGVYVEAHDKAENYKSSAYALLSCGIVGMVLIILIYFGIVPLNLAGSVKGIASVTLGLMFVIFIVMGFKSLTDSKKFAAMSDDEKKTTADIQSWFKMSYDKNAIDSKIDVADDATEEMKYFARCEQMRKIITDQFGALDPAYLEKNIEDLYQAIYEC